MREDFGMNRSVKQDFASSLKKDKEIVSLFQVLNKKQMRYFSVHLNRWIDKMEQTVPDTSNPDTVVGMSRYFCGFVVGCRSRFDRLRDILGKFDKYLSDVPDDDVGFIFDEPKDEKTPATALMIFWSDAFDVLISAKLRVVENKEPSDDWNTAGIFCGALRISEEFFAEMRRIILDILSSDN